MTNLRDPALAALGIREQDLAPVRFDGAVDALPAPRLGGHTDEILRETALTSGSRRLSDITHPC